MSSRNTSRTGSTTGQVRFRNSRTSPGGEALDHGRVVERAQALGVFQVAQAALDQPVPQVVPADLVAEVPGGRSSTR